MRFLVACIMFGLVPDVMSAIGKPMYGGESLFDTHLLGIVMVFMYVTALDIFKTK